MSPVAPLVRMAVGVVAERRKARSPWIDFVWRPLAVLPGVPETEPWTVLGSDAECTNIYVGSAEIELYRSESALYRENLTSGTPQLWIALRPTGSEPPYEVVAVTADPSEGEAFAGIGADLVEAVPMPEPIQAVVADFVAGHHGEHEFVKRERDHADPEALARRGPMKGRK